MPKNKILAIHSCDGTMLQRLSDHWMTNVKPKIGTPYQVISLLATRASRQLNPLFSQTVSDQDVVLVTGLGHGSQNAFLGWNGETLYSSQLMPAAEVNGKIVHLLSCSTAGGLNGFFRKAGCTAFIGYKDTVPIESSDPAWTDNFLLCDSQVDVKLAAGQSVNAAVQAAKTFFAVFLPNDSTGGSLVCDPADGNVWLPPTTPEGALLTNSIAVRKLPDLNAIPNRATASVPEF